MPDDLIEAARHRLAMKGLCRFDVPRSAQFDWMQAQCLKWTGGRLKMLAGRTAVAQVRILPVGDERVIVWDYEHLGQLEYLWFLLQFDNDSDLALLAQYALYRFAALVLLAEGPDYVVHAGQLIRGVQEAVPNKAEIERNQSGRHIYNNEPITVAGYLLFFHEEAHYVFRNPSASRDRYFRMASDRIEALRQKAERGIKEGDLRSIHGPRGSLLPESEAGGVYPRNIIAFMGQRQHEASFVEEVACDLFAVEQLLKSYRTDSRPETIGRLYTNVMMHYQLQATLEGLRRVYRALDHSDHALEIALNTENQIRNDIRGFYFVDQISQTVKPAPTFWLVYDPEVTRLYREGARQRYQRLVVMSATVAVLAKAQDRAWLAECEERTKKLDLDQRQSIRQDLGSYFDLVA